MTNKLLTSFLVGASLVLAAATTEAAKDPAAEAHMQAIESLQKNLAKNPKDKGLRHALTCVERSAQCTDQHGLDRAIDSVKKHSAKHPEDGGLKHALDQLERHHATLEQHHAEHEPGMHPEQTHPSDTSHGEGMMRPETPHRPETPEGQHR
jgi:hypothetical protein